MSIFWKILTRIRHRLNKWDIISSGKLATLLLNEEQIERHKDKLYWEPLRKELE